MLTPYPHILGLFRFLNHVKRYSCAFMNTSSQIFIKGNIRFNRLNIFILTVFILELVIELVIRGNVLSTTKDMPIFCVEIICQINKTSGSNVNFLSFRLLWNLLSESWKMLVVNVVQADNVRC